MQWDLSQGGVSEPRREQPALKHGRGYSAERLLTRPCTVIPGPKRSLATTLAAISTTIDCTDASRRCDVDNAGRSRLVLPAPRFEKWLPDDR